MKQEVATTEAREVAEVEGGRFGRWRGKMPSRMREAVEASRRDPDALAMRDEIALVDARIEDLLSRVDTGESGALWKALSGAYEALTEARRAKDDVKMVIALAELGDLIREGFEDSIAWSEIFGLIDRRQRLVAAERKRLIELKMVLTYDQAEEYAESVTAAIQRYLPDPEQRTQFANDLRELVGTYRRLAGSA